MICTKDEEIVSIFGIHKHPVIPHLKKDNYGVYPIHLQYLQIAVI